jgi:primase-polymerase (primpol)-like protein
LPTVEAARFTKNGIIGVDLDSIRNPKTRELLPLAAKIVADNPTYWEVSPSGTGLHAYFTGSIAKALTKTPLEGGGFIEIYDDGRFFTWSETVHSGSLDSLTAFPEADSRLVRSQFFGKQQSTLWPP